MDEDPRVPPLTTEKSPTTDGPAPQTEQLQRVASFVANTLGVGSFELDLSLVNSLEMKSLNKEHRGIDKSTDVLSFPQQEFSPPLALDGTQKNPSAGGPPQLLGDLVISAEDAAINASKIGHSLDHELAFLVVHGVLHLCGYDHQGPEEEKVMITAQKTLMSRLRTEGILS